MQINMENFTQAKIDIYSLFNDRWGLATAGTPEDHNAMTIAWGMMGTIWAKQVIAIIPRENRKTSDVLIRHDHFTVCFFPEENRKDLVVLGTKSGWDEPEKIASTALTPKPLGDAVGYEEAQLTFVCKKIYTHKVDINAVTPDILEHVYTKDDRSHYIFIGEIVDVFGTINE